MASDCRVSDAKSSYVVPLPPVTAEKAALFRGLEAALGYPFISDPLPPSPNSLIIVINRPNGVGKDAVINRLREVREEIHFVVAATSRAKRPDEMEVKDPVAARKVQKADRDRSLPSGQRGEVYEVNGDRVAVILDSNEKKTKGEADEKSADTAAKPSIYWIHIQDIEYDLDIQVEDWYIAMEALCEILPSLEPLIVYFPDTSQWLSRAIPKSNRKEFVCKVEEMLDQLSGPVVLICGQNKEEAGSKEKEKFMMILPNLGRLGKLPLSLERLTVGLKSTKRSQDGELYKLFTNVVGIHLPKDEELLGTFNKQVEEDQRIVISRSNLNELHKVLEEHELSYIELLHANTDDVILTKRKAEQVVGWAKNHYLSSCLLPSIKGGKVECAP